MKSILRNIRIFILHLLYRNRPSLLLSERTVFIAPHPDDEVMGCTGLIQNLVERETPPDVIFMTGGEGSHRGCCEVSEGRIIAERRHLALKVAGLLGIPISHVHFLDYPDEHISIDHSETEKLRELLYELHPKTVLIPHWGEGMPDHIQTSEIVKELLKDTNVSIYEYCVWMWYYNVWNLDYKNSFIVKMNKTMHKRKLRAIGQYITPLASCGKPWSGILPKPFLKAARWDKELYFRVK